MHDRVRNWGCQSHEVMKSCHFPIAVEHEYFESSSDTTSNCFISEACRQYPVLHAPDGSRTTGACSGRFLLVQKHNHKNA
jgi:hypothetical protein